jgi:hypothetical protein
MRQRRDGTEHRKEDQDRQKIFRNEIHFVSGQWSVVSGQFLLTTDKPTTDGLSN